MKTRVRAAPHAPVGVDFPSQRRSRGAAPRSAANISRRAPSWGLDRALMLALGLQVATRLVPIGDELRNALLSASLAILPFMLERGAALYFSAIAIASEGLLFAFVGPPRDGASWFLHVLVLAAFVSTHRWFPWVSAWREGSLRPARSRDSHEALVRNEAASPLPQEDETQLAGGSASAQEQLVSMLRLLSDCMGLANCVLLVPSDRECRRMFIAGAARDEAALKMHDIDAQSGVIAAILRRGLVMRLNHIRPDYAGLSYYDTPLSSIRGFIGVPLIENGKVQGVLCGDRRDDRPLSPEDEETLQQGVFQIERIRRHHALFERMESTKRQQAILYRASKALGAALSEEAAIDAGLRAAQEIAAFDFAALTRFDSDQRQHSVHAVCGEGAERFRGLSFRDNHSLVAMAVRNRHYLPYRDSLRPQNVFTEKMPLKGMSSLLVLPLGVRDHVLGTWVLAAKRENVFEAAVRQNLRVLSNLLAVSLSNAAAFRRLEELATTDALSGCANKRKFLEELDAKIRAAQRFGRKLSLVVTDIDYFKKINDTYGHRAGDAVLRNLGELLRKFKRDTDLVARFGGEEFCVLCEETDAAGAKLFAERLREEVQEHSFMTEAGAIALTSSVGIATYPDDAAEGSALFHAADQALYAAKKRGRNRVVAAHEVQRSDEVLATGS